MSSRQRKWPGGAVGSTPARKRSRLLPSSAGGASQTEPIDLEESGAPAFEPDIINLRGEEDIIDLTGESSEPEVITISDYESPGNREQSQQQPHVSRASENSVEPLARNDEGEPREDDGDWQRFDFDPQIWSDEDSQAREQNQEHSHLSRSAENSAGPLTTLDEVEPRDNDGAWPADPASSPMREGDSSQEQDKEQSQQYPLGSRDTVRSAELRASDNEEEPRDNNDSINSDEWPDRFESPPTWQDDITDDWEESQQYSLCSRSAENSLELLASNLQQEPQDIEFEPLRGFVSPPNWDEDNAELLQVHGQERRNVTLNSQEQVHGSDIGTGANDAPVADSAPAGQGAEEENTGSSDSASSSAQQGVVIRCPICMEFYSEIMQHGRQLVATMCGHVFCSRCLPVALETTHMCPTCRVELNPEVYIPIYL